MRWINYFLALVCVLFWSGCAWSGDLYSVGFPKVSLNNGERVVGYKIRVRSGQIHSLPVVPTGWNVTVDNDPSWNATVHGSIIVGAAALDKKELGLLDQLVTVEKAADAIQLKESPFTAEADLFLVDFIAEKERTITVTVFLKTLPTAGGSAEGKSKRQ